MAERKYQLITEDAWGRKSRRGSYASQATASKAARGLVSPKRGAGRMRRAIVKDTKSGKTLIYRG